MPQLLETNEVAPRAVPPVRRRRPGLIRSKADLFFVVLFLCGFGLVVYLLGSNFFSWLGAQAAASSYDEHLARVAQEENLAQMRADAEAYNQALFGSNGGSIVVDAAMQKALSETVQGGSVSGSAVTENEDTVSASEEYASLVNPFGDGLMGYIKIDSINVALPINHGADSRVLSTSVGHMPGSSLPVGGESTHAVLVGHSGLPTAELFTHLESVAEGDTFVLDILGENLTYKVIDRQVVLPNDMSGLRIEPGRDLVTLVTCTPYGQNTHRLLVTGERVANDVSETVQKDGMALESVLLFAIIGIGILGAVGAIAFVVVRRKGHRHA